jgi:hypothetical protein
LKEKNWAKAAGKTFNWFAPFRDGPFLWKIIHTCHPSTLYSEKSVVDFCYAVDENR